MINKRYPTVELDEYVLDLSYEVHSVQGLSEQKELLMKIYGNLLSLGINEIEILNFWAAIDPIDYHTKHQSKALAKLNGAKNKIFDIFENLCKGLL